MKQSLYELTNNLESLEELNESAWELLHSKIPEEVEQGKELIKNIEQALEIGKEDYYNKINDICKLRQNLLARINSNKTEIKRMNNNIDKDECLISLLENKIKQSITQLEKPEIKTELFKVSLRNSSSVNTEEIQKIITDSFEFKHLTSALNALDSQNNEKLSEIIEKYFNVKISVIPDKIAISNAIKNGVEIQGAFIDHKQNLSIK